MTVYRMLVPGDWSSPGGQYPWETRTGENTSPFLTRLAVAAIRRWSTLGFESPWTSYLDRQPPTYHEKHWPLAFAFYGVPLVARHWMMLRFLYPRQLSTAGRAMWWVILREDGSVR